MQTYLLDVIERLRNERGLTLSDSPRSGIASAMQSSRKSASASGAPKPPATRLALFSDHAPVEVGPQRVFTLDPRYYPVSGYYEGPFSFTNHYYHTVGAMNGEGLRARTH